MKIFLDQYESLQKIIDENNKVTPQKLNLQGLVNSLTREALENPSFDWEGANKLHYNFWTMQQKGLLADAEEVKNAKLDLNLYKQLSVKVGGFPQDKNVRIDKINNLIAGILVGTKYQVIKIKEDIINNSWSTDLIIAVLAKYDWLYNLKYSEDFIKIDCPSCGHSDFGIWINKNEECKYIGVKCDSASCKIGNGADIWGLFEKVVGLEKEKTIEEIFDILLNLKKDEIREIEKEAGYRVRNKKEQANNIDFTKIFETLKNNSADSNNFGYEYMYKLGFRREDLIDGDVYFKDGEREFNEFDKLRNRVCYVVKNINKNVIGIQARSIYETEKERLDFIKNEDDYIKGKYPNVYKQMVEKKALNTSGEWTSQNLYLLYKYRFHNAKNLSIKKLIITEGPKDALRVYAQHFANTAIAASFSNKLTDAQIDLFEEVFDKEKITVELAYDNDIAGFEGNLKAYEKLKKAGFKNVRFALYVAKNKSTYYNDFGEINARKGTTKKILECLNPARPLKNYVEEMHKRNIASQKIEKEIEEFEKENKEEIIKIKEEKKENIRKKEEKEKEESNTEYKDSNDIVFSENEDEYEIENEFVLYPTDSVDMNDEWFEKLNKFVQKEIENNNVDINTEIKNLEENGFAKWYMPFRAKYGDMPYVQALISAKIRLQEEKEDKNIAHGDVAAPTLAPEEEKKEDVKVNAETKSYVYISYADLCKECAEKNESVPF